MSDVLEQVDFILLEDELHATTCESVYEQENGWPEHEAHWYAGAPCGDIIAVCDKRRAKARRDGGWWCTPKTGSGCSGYHDYAVLEFRRITQH